MPNSRPYNRQAPACCSHLKCLNDRPVAWTGELSVGAGASVQRVSAGLEIVSVNNGEVGVQDTAVSIDPTRNFEIVANMNDKSGPSPVQVGLSNSDLSNTAYLLVASQLGSSLALIWGNGSGGSTTKTLHVPSVGDKYQTIKLRRKGTKLRIEIAGVTAQEFDVDSNFPTTRLYPSFFVGSPSGDSTDGVLASYCVGYI